MSEIVIVVTGQTGPTFASATTIADAGGYFAATTVEGALQEEAAARVAHIADTVDAHDASAISFAPTGTIAATDVQAAVAEVASESVQASVLTTNGDVLTRAAGVPARITRADLAADSAFSSRYQPLDSDLTAIADLTTTTFGRSLLTSADAAALRTAAALGTMSTQAANSVAITGGTMSGVTGIIRTVRAVRTSGNITINSTTWVDVDSGLDLVLPAVAGDRVQVGISAVASNEAVVLYLDVVSMVGGSPVNSWGRDAAPSNTHSGVAAWLTFATNDRKVGGSTDPRPLVSGDISGGNVTLRLRARTFSAANRIINADTDNPLRIWAINLGQ